MSDQGQRELWQQYMLLLNFTLKLLDPEQFGHAVTAEVRDAAREAIGIKKSESSDSVKT
jgi:hypothetical protein